MEFVFSSSMITLILSVQDGSNNLSKKNIAPIKEAYMLVRTKGYEYDSHGATLFYYIFKKIKWVPDSEYNIVALFVCGGTPYQKFYISSGEKKDEWNY